MRLPDFLIIGAMKSGTISLYFDLGAHPAIFLPDNELTRLASDEVLTFGGKQAYADSFTGPTPIRSAATSRPVTVDYRTSAAFRKERRR